MRRLIKRLNFEVSINNIGQSAGRHDVQVYGLSE